VDAQVTDPSRRILAVVLTHNAPEALERCLRAIAEQSQPPDGLLVVDNASRPPAALPEGYPVPSRMVRSDVNTGPAGGYATALADFLVSDFRHAWVLDDDMLPEPDCLQHLWTVASRDPDRAFLFPLSVQTDGSVAMWPSWCGFLIAHPIVQAVGLPMEELFWWAEDTEYLQCRVPGAGYPQVVVHEAVVHHEAIRQRSDVPLWKYYYESRNMLYVHLYVKRRIGRYPRNMSRLVARAVLREGSGRSRRLWVIGRGLSDGARGRLGIRFPPEALSERAPGRSPSTS